MTPSGTPTTVPEVAETPATPVAPPVSEAPVTTQAPVVTEAPAPQIVTLAQGTFIPRGRYSGEGTAVVLNDGSEQRFVRFENFSTDNGPDLRVYLSASDANGDSGAFDDDFIDLGVLKGNIGDQNYDVPASVDLDELSSLSICCELFNVSVGAAALPPV